MSSFGSKAPASYIHKGVSEYPLSYNEAVAFGHIYSLQSLVTHLPPDTVNLFLSCQMAILATANIVSKFSIGALEFAFPHKENT